MIQKRKCSMIYYLKLNKLNVSIVRIIIIVVINSAYLIIIDSFMFVLSFIRSIMSRTFCNILLLNITFIRLTNGIAMMEKTRRIESNEPFCV